MALLEAHFTDSVGGDNGRNMLAADREIYLSHESTYFDVGNAPNELVPAAYPPEIGTTLCNVAVFCRLIEEPVDFFLWDAMVSASSLHRSDFPLVDPLFQRWIADAQHLRGFTRRE